MKKIIILGLVLLMVVAFATAALANANVQKLVPYAYPGQDAAEPDASGQAIVNNSEGDVVLELTVSVKGLKPDEEYTVIFGKPWFPPYPYDLFTFKTNKKGNGHFHINLRVDDLQPDPSAVHIMVNLKETNTTVLIDEGWPF
jgi:hypothetical protein